MINLSFDLKDKKAARIFGQAMIDYSGEDGKAEAPVQADCDDLADRVHAEMVAELAAPVEVQTEPTPQPEPVQVNETPQPEPVGPAPADAPTTDENGVAFNADFCGKAKVPFYASGKHKGQWKRKQKVDENAYDAWYAAEHIKVQTGPATLIKPVAPDTAAAFGGGTPESVEVDDAPTGAGELMKWISEQMNAGNLTQGDVDSGYATAEVTPADLFSGDADAVTKLYGVLTAVIAA